MEYLKENWASLLKILAGTALVIGLGWGIATMIIAENNEPTHGTITQLLYHKPYTSMYYTTMKVGNSTIQTPHYVHHPERYEVVYALFNYETNEMEYGDCDVPEMMWLDLAVGDEFVNFNKVQEYE